MNLVVFYAVFYNDYNDFYAVFYNDVTHFLTDPNEIFTAYVKFEIKDIFFLENFVIFRIFIEKITIYYQNHI